MAVLAWIGERARWVMPGGIVLGMLAPELSGLLRPVLPALLCLVLGLSMARLDLREAVEAAVGRALPLLALCGLLMPGWALLLWIAGAALPPEWRALLVYTAMAPPIASAAGLAFMMGLNARLALELTVLATLLTPALGPLVIALLLEPAPSLAPSVLAGRLFLTLLGGVLLALAIRRFAGPARIAAAGTRFDGAVALAMAAFFVSLFDGFGPALIQDPLRGLYLSLLVIALNTGLAIGVAALSRRISAPNAAGALGLVAGNRTVALYVAVLPADPLLSLYTALYQIPMSLTPLLRRLLQGPKPPAPRPR
ncbi:MAG: hypothetical protein AAGC92_02780 [Pseudomonadota bacterium]